MRKTKILTQRRMRPVTSWAPRPGLRWTTLTVAALISGLTGLQLLIQSEAATPKTQAGLAKTIENVKAAKVYRYGSKDSKGTAMDTAKVIANPSGGYLAVYHDTPSHSVKLASSTDLKKWTFRANLDKGSQATIAASPDKGFIVAHEANNGGGFIRVMHYPNLKALYAAKADKVYSSKRSLSKCNEGTPNITSMSLKPNIANSVIKLNFHYHNGCNTDRQGVATLTNFSRWTTSKLPAIDSAVLAEAKANGISLGGNIGDRDIAKFGSTRYMIIEAQAQKGAQGENGSFKTWRSYLYNLSTNKARILNVKTHKGSTAFANPTMTAAKGPDGSQGFIVSFFIPGEAAAAGEGGTLIYYVRTSNPPIKANTLPARLE